VVIHAMDTYPYNVGNPTMSLLPWINHLFHLCLQLGSTTKINIKILLTHVYLCMHTIL